MQRNTSLPFYSHLLSQGVSLRKRNAEPWTWLFIHSFIIHSLSPAFLSFYSDPQIRHPGRIFTFNTGVDNTFNSRLEWYGLTLLDAVKVATIPSRGAVQFRCGVNQNQSSDKHDPSFSLFCFHWKGNFSTFVGRVTTLRTACLDALLHSCKSGL